MKSMRRVCLALLAIVLLSSPARAQQTFGTGSLIIPMDVDYQNAGMLRAYGLLYKLLLAGVPVNWCILPGKTLYTGTTAFPADPGNSVDFTASATDTRTNAVITNHGYRGGPFVVDAAYHDTALAIVNAWTAANPSVAVHAATAPFSAYVSRVLVNAPNIGINADGHECIAFSYLNAAGIPDSKGQSWPAKCQSSYLGYPDIMTPAQIAGPTTTSHTDGALFGPTGLPRYCQLMSMHWTVDRSATPEEAVAEMQEYLQYPTHLFAECQAVNEIEDSANGHFATTDNGTGEPQKSIACFQTPDNGLCAGSQPSTVTLFHSDLPFAQFDGAFKTVGGSEPGYGWAPSSSYYDDGIVMMRNSSATAFGVDDLWMTGTVRAQCRINSMPHLGALPQSTCAAYGKFSYLGGHQYTTSLPILSNPQTQGVHLFLNSLFEAACTTAEGQPSITLTKIAPATTSSPLVTFEIDWANAGPGIAVAAELTDTLPDGASFVSATGGGSAVGSTVTWSLGDLGPAANGRVTVTAQLAAYGTYANQATLAYRVGNSARTATSNQTHTAYAAPPDMAVVADMAGSLCAGVSCAPPANPCQQATCDPQTGGCVTSNVGDGTACSTGDKCVVGQTCTAGVCGGGATVQCPASSNPCQTASCDPAQGCVTSNVDDGTSCSNGDQCVTGMVCHSGACTGGMSVSCPASLNPCEASTCSPSTGCGFVALADGTSCTSDSACITGTTCTGGVCGGGSGTVCPPPSAPCTVSTCDVTTGCGSAFAPDGTDPNGDCASVGACANACNGAGACQRTCVTQGATCSDGSVCSTGNCVDGVCCDTACDGTCQACNLAGHVGTCTPIDDGTDPAGECGAGSVCDGAGGCRAVPDMALGPDLSTPADLSTAADLAAGSADLAGGGADLSGSGSSGGGADLSGSGGAAGDGDMAAGGGTPGDNGGSTGMGGGMGGGPGGAPASGCGCAVGGAPTRDGQPLAATALVALAFGLWLRRRRLAGR